MTKREIRIDLKEVYQNETKQAAMVHVAFYPYEMPSNLYTLWLERKLKEYMEKEKL